MEFTLLIGALGLVSLGVLFLTFGCVLKKLHQAEPPALRHTPLVAILKPLKGVDGGLEENLLAFYQQTYDCFELILGAEDASDPALEVARRVAARFPERTTRILCGSWPDGMNPKVRILLRLIEATQARVILVSDSNVRPDPEYLSSLTARMFSEDADLVHNLLAGSAGEGLGGRLEDLQLGGWIAASVAFTDEGGHPCVIGKSMLMRRDALEQVGGFQAVCDFLAEDYLLGSLFHAANKRIAISSHPLAVVNTGHGVSGFWNRHVRWGQMRRRIALGCYLGEVFANPTPLLLTAWALSDGVLSFLFGAAQVAKWTAELCVVRRLAGRLDGRTALLLPLKDLLMLPIWVTGLFRRTVNWRGNKMLVGEGSRLIPLEQCTTPAPMLRPSHEVSGKAIAA